MNKTEPLLGIKANWQQFWLLVAINAFVGAMVGLERTVVPLLAEAEFGITSVTAMMSFIATFGAVKAATNLVAGRLGDRYGRKALLVLGWAVGFPVPFLIIWAPNWGWIVAANVLLGVSQGFAWSMTVIMKIDLAGPKRRGLALGINESAGYLAVALSALVTGYLAQSFGLRPEPFYFGIAVAAVGLGLSIAFVRDTMHHVAVETRDTVETDDGPSVFSTFAQSTWRHPALSSVSQAGLVNNLNDGLAWGVFPLLFFAAGLSVGEVALLSFLYPAVWGVSQLGTGALSDRFGRKWMIALGMILQGLALLAIASFVGLQVWLAASVLLGFGTALVYPTLLAAVSDVAHPSWRGTAIGVYRMWRDLGYVAGAVIAGLVADRLGLEQAVMVVGVLTICSGLIVVFRMPETAPAVGLRASTKD